MTALSSTIDGTAYEIREIGGLADQPDLRTADRTRLRRHGLLPGDDFLGGRAVTVSLEVFGADDAAFAAAMNALKLALQPGYTVSVDDAGGEKGSISFANQEVF